MTTLGFTTLAQIPGSSDGQQLFSVAVSPTGRYVAVGQGGAPDYNLITSVSTNGSTWSTPTEIANSQYVTLYSLVFDSVSNYFVGVGIDGSGNAIFGRSTDGLSWTIGSMGTPTYANIVSVAVDLSGVFMAVGGPGADVPFGAAGVNDIPIYSTSTDGITWTTPSNIGSATFGLKIVSVTTNNTGNFLAIGTDDGTSTLGAAVSVFATYSNGSWTTPMRSSSNTPVNMASITVNSSGLYVVVGRDITTMNGEAPTFIRSSDGVTWTEPSLFNAFSTHCTSTSTYIFLCEKLVFISRFFSAACL